MRQKITICMYFPDLSRRLAIEEVYQKDNFLIAVSSVVNTGNYGEAIYEDKEYITAITNADKTLPIKHYIINPGTRSLDLKGYYTEVKSKDDIREIAGLQALQTEEPSSRTQRLGLFSGSTARRNDTRDESKPALTI